MNKLVLTVIGIFLLALIIIYVRDGGFIFVSGESRSVYEQLTSSPNKKQTVQLMQEAQIKNTLESDITVTVFAPNNEAYAKLPKETLSRLTEPSDIHDPIYTANNHLVLGNYPSSSFYDGLILISVNAEQLKITKKANNWYINDTTKITVLDTKSKNGVVHEIDQVLLPAILRD